MRKILTGFVLAALWIYPAVAGQITLLGAGKVGGSPPTYTGPLDVVGSNIKLWVGLRAASTADRGNRLINICDAADANCADWSSDATTGALVPATVGSTDCTAVTTCTIKIWYDRSGGTVCTTACDLSQATAANRATFTWNGGKPYAIFDGTDDYYASPNLGGTYFQPQTVSTVVMRPSVLGATQVIFGNGSAAWTLNYRNSANTVGLTASGASPATVGNVTDGNFHALTASFTGIGIADSALMCGGSAGTNCSTGGTDNTGLTVGTATATAATPMTLSASSNPAIMQFREIGWWSAPTGFTGTQRTNMTANQYGFWGSF